MWVMTDRSRERWLKDHPRFIPRANTGMIINYRKDLEWYYWMQENMGKIRQQYPQVKIYKAHWISMLPVDVMCPLCRIEGGGCAE